MPDDLEREALIKRDSKAAQGELLCEDCWRSFNVLGYGTHWKCKSCGHWNTIPAEELYSRRRKVFLAQPEHKHSELLMKLMLETVTLTVPDLDKVAAEPWPKSKARPPAPKKPGRPIDRMNPRTVLAVGLIYGAIATSIIWFVVLVAIRA